MKKNSYSDLKNKTIFDFCDNQEIIDEIVVIGKDAYLAYVKLDPSLNALHLMEYAQRINDRALEIQVKTQFKKELAEMFDE